MQSLIRTGYEDMTGEQVPSLPSEGTLFPPLTLLLRSLIGVNLPSGHLRDDNIKPALIYGASRCIRIRILEHKQTTVCVLVLESRFKHKLFTHFCLGIDVHKNDL